jgi:hypothetical protein
VYINDSLEKAESNLHFFFLRKESSLDIIKAPILKAKLVGFAA